VTWSGGATGAQGWSFKWIKMSAGADKSLAKPHIVLASCLYFWAFRLQISDKL
jgi:hypothetical protein